MSIIRQLPQGAVQLIEEPQYRRQSVFLNTGKHLFLGECAQGVHARRKIAFYAGLAAPLAGGKCSPFALSRRTLRASRRPNLQAEVEARGAYGRTRGIREQVLTKNCENEIELSVFSPLAICTLQDIANKIRSPDAFAYLCDALVREIHRLHQLGFAHGDVNAANVLLWDDQAVVSLCDFEHVSRDEKEFAKDFHDATRVLYEVWTMTPAGKNGEAFQEKLSLAATEGGDTSPYAMLEVLYDCTEESARKNLAARFGVLAAAGRAKLMASLPRRRTEDTLAQVGVRLGTILARASFVPPFKNRELPPTQTAALLAELAEYARAHGRPAAGGLMVGGGFGIAGWWAYRNSVVRAVPRRAVPAVLLAANHAELSSLSANSGVLLKTTVLTKGGLVGKGAVVAKAGVVGKTAVISNAGLMGKAVVAAKAALISANMVPIAATAAAGATLALACKGVNYLFQYRHEVRLAQIDANIAAFLQQPGMKVIATYEVKAHFEGGEVRYTLHDIDVIDNALAA